MCEKVKRRLKRAGFFVTIRRRLANDLGTQLRLSGGPVVDVYDTGRIRVQGKNSVAIERVKEVLGLAQTPRR